MAEVSFTVRVRPGASRTQVGGAYGDPPALVVAVHAPAVDGRANEAVIAALAEEFGVRPRDVRLVSGQTSRTKIVAVETPRPELLAARLDHLRTGH